MATNDDMRKRFDNWESRFDQLEKKVDQLPTKADLSGLATKADLTLFKEEIIKDFRILAEDAKVSVKKAAEGYKGTLDRIERDLVALNKKMDDSLSVHDQALTNHVGRIAALEQATGLTPK